MEIYRNGKTEIEHSRLNCRGDLASLAKGRLSEMFQRIYQQIRQDVTFRNANHLVNGVLLDAARLNANLRLIYTSLKEIRNQTIYALVSRQSQSKYEEVHYDYDGSILSREELGNLESLPDPVPLSEIPISIEIPPNTWNKIKEWFANTFLGSLFEGVKRNVEENQRAFREDLVTAIRRHEHDYQNRMENSLLANVDECYRILRQRFEARYKAIFGGEAKMEAKLRSLHEKHACSIVKPYPYARRLAIALRRGAKR